MTWQKTTIGALGQIITGKTPSTQKHEFWQGDYPFITPKDIQNSKHIFSTRRSLSELGAQQTKRVLLPPNSICVSCIGNLGYAAMTITPSITNQQINSIIPSPQNNPSFIYYLLKNMWADFKNLEGQSTTISILNKTLFSKIEIQIPNKETQERIAALLSSFDNKIENNNAINKNLEAQIRILYKNWFIDFEPFQKEKFVHTESGKIPQNWKFGTLQDLLEIRYGKSHQALADGTIPAYGSGGIIRSVEKPLYSKEAVLIPRKGTLNNVVYKNTPFWCTDTMFYSIEKTPNAAKYAYIILKTMDLVSLNNGSVVPSLTVDVLKDIRIIIPPASVLKKFNAICKTLFQQINYYDQESEHLANIRDTLLPQVMSNKIKIPHTQPPSKQKPAKRK